MNKKSMILIFLVSLVVLVSACTVNLPKINAPKHGCCAVIKDNSVIGCINDFTDVSCNALYSKFGDGIEFTPGNCTENEININKCSGVTSCMGYNASGSSYLLNDQDYECNSNKLYNCNNKEINLVSACSDDSLCNAYTRTCGPLGCCQLRIGANAAGCADNLIEINCYNYFDEYGNVLYNKYTTCDRWIACGSVLNDCMGVFNENGINYTYLLDNQQKLCGPIRTNEENKLYVCDAGSLSFVQQCDSEFYCDKETFNCKQGVDPGYLKLYMNFDDGTATDLSDNGNNGILVKSPSLVAGFKGTSAYQFNGNLDPIYSNYVKILNSLSLNPSNITLSAWFYPVADANGYYTVIGKSATASTDPYYEYGFTYAAKYNNQPLHQLAFNLAIGSGSDFTIYSQPEVAPIRKWTHIVGTFNGTDSKLYVNGMEVASGKRPNFNQITSKINNLGIGARLYSNSGVDRQLAAIVDEIRIYDKALTDQQVGDLYNACPFVCNNDVDCDVTQICQNPGTCESICV